MIKNYKIILLLLALIHFPVYPQVTFTPEAAIDSHEARSIMFQMGNSFLLSRALAAAAQLGIADHLIHTAKTSTQLAKDLYVHEELLFRLMRMLASHNIFTINKENQFALTQLGELLVTG